MTPATQAACIGIGIGAQSDGPSPDGACIGVDPGALPPQAQSLVAEANQVAGGARDDALQFVADHTPGDVVPAVPACATEPPLFALSDCINYIIQLSGPLERWATQDMPAWTRDVALWGGDASSWGNEYVAYVEDAADAQVVNPASGYATSESVAQLGYAERTRDAGVAWAVAQSVVLNAWALDAEAQASGYTDAQSADVVAWLTGYQAQLDAYVHATIDQARADAGSYRDFVICSNFQPPGTFCPPASVHVPGTPPLPGQLTREPVPGIGAPQVIVPGLEQPQVGEPSISPNIVLPGPMPEFPLPPMPPTQPDA